MDSERLLYQPETRPCIVVIERDPSIGEVISLLLTGQGYRVCLWPQGQSACEYVRQQQADLIIIDTWLESRETGWQVLDQMWADPATRDLPVIVCSADVPRLAEHEQQLHNRRRFVLEQPFDVEDLLSAVQAALDG